MCFIIATEDDVVRNDYIEEFAKLKQNYLGEVHYVQDADHSEVCYNEHYGSQVVRSSVAFLDKLIDARSSI